MRYLQIYTLIVFYFIFSSCQESDVVFSTIVFRHGDRTPIELYPNDPNQNYSLWKELGLGQLTKTGKLQHYNLGKWFRQRYDLILSNDYKFNQIYVQSTDVDRTIMSALSNLAGLYPPDPNQIWSDKIKDWQPIPVHTVPETEDNVLAGKEYCQKYQLEMDQLLSSSTFRKFDEINAELYSFISKNTGRNISSIHDLGYIYDTLYIEEMYQLPLPNWTKTVYPSPLRDWSIFSFRIQCFTQLLARLKVGLLLNDIVERLYLKSVQKLNPDRSLWIYSGHDLTIANLMMAMNVYNFQNPPYASALIFELRKSNNTYGVSIYLKNDSNSQPYLLQLPSCNVFCELSDFKEYLKPILITQDQWKYECHVGFLNSFYYISKMNTTAIFVILAVTVIILLLLTTAAIILTYVNKNRHSGNRLYLRLNINDDCN